MRDNILYVDDEKSNLVVFKNTFWEKFEVFCAGSANEGLEILEKNLIPLVIADQRMPVTTGVEFLEKVKEKYPQSIRMILTGYTDVNDIIAAINRGHVYKFITKPWDKDDLAVTIERALEAYKLARENERLIDNLVRSEKLATVGQLASSIAHEIKNQLSALSFGELIREKYPDDERLQKYSHMIVEARERLLGLINEIREFAKGETGTKLNKKSHSLVKTAEEVLSFMRLDKDLKRKNIVTKFEEVPEFHYDNDKIRQVLINLLKNAAQAMKDDGGEITIAVGPGGADRAWFSVSDTGCGIPEENLGRIWEPFFTTKEDIGTGLGLDICKKIIEGHKGTIECSSKVGTGTTFKVRLPMNADKADAKQ